MIVRVLAPAKINLMLDVTGKRSDGYHTLTTIMKSVSLSDIVTISKRNDGLISVTSSDLSIPSDEKNIAYKAFLKFSEYTNFQHSGIDIHIQKNIPSEAGLGGGSADAAAVLVGLNNMFSANLSLEQLCDIGVSIGADVPFCITGGTKLCTGIGEIMNDVSDLEKCCIVIAKGDTGISTPKAFEKIDAVGFERKASFTKYDGSINSVKKIGFNRFELVADNADISFIKNIMLDMGAEYSAMSGSGSAVFGLFYNDYSAEKCRDFLQKSGLFSTLCYPIENGAAIIA